MRFPPVTVWLIKTPAFDTRTKPEFVGAPLQRDVLLTRSIDVAPERKQRREKSEGGEERRDKREGRGEKREE